MSTELKGITVSIWIWITGGLLLAGITLAMAYINLSTTACQVSRQNAVDQFNGLNSDIEFACRQAPGTRTTRTVSLGCGVRAIFAADSRGEPPDRVPALITDAAFATGKQVCLTFGNSHYGCQEHACTVNMTYIGTPAPGSDMYTLGRQDGAFDFDLTVRKDADGTVSVQAEHVP